MKKASLISFMSSRTHSQRAGVLAVALLAGVSVRLDEIYYRTPLDQWPTTDWIVGALQGNRVQGGVFGYPATSRALKLGNRLLLHIPTLNIPYASTGVSTRGDIIRDDPDLVRRYLSAEIEAIALMKKDRVFTMKVLSKYLRTNDMDLLAESYDIQIGKYMMKTPLTTADAVRSIL